MPKAQAKRTITTRLILNRHIKYGLLAGGVTVNSSMGIPLGVTDGKLKRWVAFKTGDGRWQIKVGPFDMSELSIVELAGDDIQIISNHDTVRKLVTADDQAMRIYTDEVIESGNGN